MDVTMHRTAVAIGLGVLVLFGVPRAWAQPALAEYAVLGVEGVRLGAGVRVRSGGVGALAGTVTLGRGVRVAGTVAADMVRLQAQATIGRAFCRLVTRGAVVGRASLPLCLAFTPPLVDPGLLPVPLVTPGVENLHIPARTGTAPIAPGSFADVVVGRGSLLQLAGGAYSARSIRVAPGGRIACAAACEIGVQESLLLRRSAELGAPRAAQADTVRVNLATVGEIVAMRARTGAVVTATIYAPGADVVLGAGGTYRGAFVGRTVRVGAGAEVRADSAL
jgi:hypothetical protein